MRKHIKSTLILGACLIVVACGSTSGPELEVTSASGLNEGPINTPYTLHKNGNQIQIKRGGLVYFQSPKDGHFVIGTAMKNGWPSAWTSEDGSISCRLLTDAIPCPEDTDISIQQPIELKANVTPSPGKTLQVKEVLAYAHGAVRAVRTWYWPGGGVVTGLTLSANWNVDGAIDAPITMPGSMLYGNPHEGRTSDEDGQIRNDPGLNEIPSHMGQSLYDMTYLEEHRITSPFVSVEWKDATNTTRGAALHVVPSLVLDKQGTGIGGSFFYRNKIAKQAYDQWWSLGATSHTGVSQSIAGEGTVLGLLSGPTAKNHGKGIVNTSGDMSGTDGRALNYQTDLSMLPGTEVEKTYFLEAIANTSTGWSFTQAMNTAMDIAQFKYEPAAYWHGDYFGIAKPGLKKLQTLLNYAFNQWTGYGFGWNHGDEVMLGWASQSEIPPYATLGLYDFQPLDWDSLVPSFLVNGSNEATKKIAFDLAISQVNMVAEMTPFYAANRQKIGTINDVASSTVPIYDFDAAFGRDSATQGSMPIEAGSFLNKSQGVDNMARTIETFVIQNSKSALRDAQASGLNQVKLDKWKKWLSAASNALTNTIKSNITSNDASIKPFWLDTDGWMGYSYGVSPLLRAYRLLPEDSHREEWKSIALQLADAYKERYGDMRRVYWGGTSDCGCEDKEGSWGAAQAFLAARDFYQSQLDAGALSDDTKRSLQTSRDAFQKAALHALYVTHSYTYIWNVKMPPDRTLAKDFDTRGLTLVSVGHIHIDALGARYADEFRMNASALGNETLWTAVSKSLLAGALELQDPRFVSTDTPNTRYSMYGGIAEQFFPSNWCYYCDTRTQNDFPFTWRGEVTKAYGPLWSVAHVLGTFTQMRLGGADPVLFLDTPSNPWSN